MYQAAMASGPVPDDTRGLCCIWSTGGMPKPLLAEGSDRQSQLGERGSNSKACWLLDREFVVAASKVLDQGMPGQHDRGAAVLFEPARRPEPRVGARKSVVCVELRVRQGSHLVATISR
jgi:hypothetical protein